MNTNELGSGSPDLNSPISYCIVDRCDSESLIVLREKKLCLQHFLAGCYEWLDQLDPLARNKFISQSEALRVRSLIQECSNRALLVSLRCETLTNLDRSRLLDILLRASDLLFTLRNPANNSSWRPAHPQESPKAERSRKISLGSQLHSNKSYGF